MLVGYKVRLRTMVKTDAEAIMKMYEEGIQTGHATFEAEVPDWHKWDSGHLTQCRWLAEEEDTVLGWGALTQVSPRKVYSGVAEVSIYVHEKHGFRKSGTRRQLTPMSFGSMAGEWRDPVLMERRSKIAGI